MRSKRGRECEHKIEMGLHTVNMGRGKKQGMFRKDVAFSEKGKKVHKFSDL